MRASASSDCGVVSPASLRASFSAFSSASARALSLRLPALAVFFSSFGASTSVAATLAIAASISAIVFFSVTSSFSSAA
ncbi:hypothetical protein FQZ97_1091490 [compost metagenome]